MTKAIQIIFYMFKDGDNLTDITSYKLQFYAYPMLAFTILFNTTKNCCKVKIEEKSVGLTMISRGDRFINPSLLIKLSKQTSYLTKHKIYLC